MQTLSFGYLKPQTPDRGPDVFPALEQNIQRINDHNHDGTNSALLTYASIVPITQSLVGVAWEDLTNGNFRTLVTVPAGVQVGSNTIRFRDGDGNPVLLSTSRVNANQFYVYTNDTSQTYTVVYGI
jgi:hypothetical protein